MVVLGRELRPVVGGRALPCSLVYVWSVAIAIAVVAPVVNNCVADDKLPDNATAPPVGKHVDGGVQCDYMIVLQWPVAAEPIGVSGYRSTTAVFVRYWITADAMRAEILWAEPSFQGGVFPGYAPGVIIAADSTRFVLGHAYRQSLKEFAIPFGERPRLGEDGQPYALQNMRFAWQRALDSRLSPFELSHSANSQCIWDPEQSLLTCTSGEQIVKQIKYSIKQNEEAPLNIVRQQVELSEERVPIYTSAFIRKSDGKVMRKIYGRRRLDGRSIDVEWQARSIAGETVIVPTSIDVVTSTYRDKRLSLNRHRRLEVKRNARKEVVATRVVETNLPYSRYQDLPAGVLRFARLRSVAELNIEADQMLPANADAVFAAAWTPSEREWYQTVQGRYWRKRATLSKSEQERIRDLLYRFLQESSVRKGEVFRLREGYVVIITSLVLDDHEMFEQTISEYADAIYSLNSPSLASACQDAILELCNDWSVPKYRHIAEEVFDRLAKNENEQ